MLERPSSSVQNATNAGESFKQLVNGATNAGNHAVEISQHVRCHVAHALGELLKIRCRVGRQLLEDLADIKTAEALNIIQGLTLEVLERLDSTLNKRILGKTFEEFGDGRSSASGGIHEHAEALSQNIARQDEIRQSRHGIADGRRDIKNADIEVLQQQRHGFNGDTESPAHQRGKDLQNTEDALECSGQLIQRIVINNDGFRESIERSNDVI